MADPRRNPFDGVTDFFSELGRMRSLGVRGDAGHLPEHTERNHASAWVPATDIFAVGDDLVIRVELAGVDPEDIDVKFIHGVLTVSGVRRSELDDSVAFYIRERCYGEFRRVITLPDGVSAEGIHAAFDDGLVELTVRGGAAVDDGTRINISNNSEGPTTRSVS